MENQEGIIEDKLSTSENCKNCESPSKGNYCSVCGQKRIDKRLVLKESIVHWLRVIVNLDRGLWHTTWLMIKNPSKVINEYLNGVTRPYLHPFRYLFLWLTLNVFLMFSTGAFDLIQAEMGTGVPSSDRQAAFMQELNTWMKSYMQFFFVLSIPSLAWGTKLLFKKGNLYFAEHLVLNSFSYGTSMVIGVFVLPFYFISVENMLTFQVIGFIPTILYHTYVFKSVFKESLIRTFLKSIAAQIVWIIGFFVVMVFLMIGYIIYLFITRPDLFNKVEETTMAFL